MTVHATLRRVALLVSGVLVMGTVGILPAQAAPTTRVVTLSGAIAQISDQDDASLERAFRVTGRGYLALDFAAEPAALELSGPISVQVTVPKTLALGATPESEFQALQDFSQGAKLRVAALVSSDGVGAMINTVPATPGIHSVYAVLVTPANVSGTAPGAGQTVAGVQAAVDYVDGFWLGESGNRVGFELAGTVPHYKSAYSCASIAGSLSMWNEAEARARTQLDYLPGENTHLSLIFPDSAQGCSGGGLGDVGTSINSGGRTWSLGSDTAQGRRILAHELGHNLSFGHANWLDCFESEPYLGASGFDADCSNVEYGDQFDTMGGSVGGKTGGSVSSPNAIRSGLWTSADYSVAPTGSTTYTLESLGSNAGKRAVVVEDSLGLNYFVEFRTFTGDDAQFSGGAGNCASGAGCVPSTPGVRILTLEKKLVNGTTTFKGLWGDDTHLLGRTVGGAKLRDYKQADVFRSQSTGGVTVTVDQVGPTTATVTVNRPTNGLTADATNGNPYDVDDPKGAWIARTHGGFDNYWRVGDTLTALLGDAWVAESYSFQWYRWPSGANGAVAIAGATDQSYTLLPEDKGSVRVIVTGAVGASSSSVTLPDVTYTGFAVKEGILVQGSVSISQASSTLTAKLKNWTTAGASYSYEWYRGATVIPGATGATYQRVAADSGHALRVRVTASRPGFASLTAESAAVADDAPAPTENPAITATLSPIALSAAFPAITSTGAVTTQQWLRGDSPIAGATKTTYAPVAADVGTRLKLVVTTTRPGLDALVRSSAPVSYATDDVALPLVTGTPRLGSTLTATAPTYTLEGETVEAPVRRFQWYRSGAAIAGAAAQTYTLAALDVAKTITVRSTGRAPDGTVTVSALSVKTPVIAKRLIAGTLAVPQVTQKKLVLSAALPAASVTESGVLRSWQWLRNGVVIKKATKPTFTLTAADRNKVISARVTLSKTNYATTVLVSAVTNYTVTASAPIVLSGTAKIGGGVLTVNEPSYSLKALPVTPTVTRTWYRNGVKFTNAGTSYTIKPSDFGKSIRVTVTATAAGSLSYSASTPKRVIGKGELTGTLAVPTMGRVAGSLVLTAIPAHTTNQASATSWQWLRNGVVIKGATGKAYKLTMLDRNKTVGPRAVVTRKNYATVVLTAVPFNYTLQAETVPVVTGTVRVALPVTVSSVDYSSLDWPVAAPVRSYQWLRAGVVIPKATGASYTPVAADKGKLLSVRVMATFAGLLPSIVVTPAVLVAPGVPVVPSTPLPQLTTNAVVGATLSIAPREYSENAAAAYQWLRNGVAIPKATASSYLLVTSDRGTAISVRVTASAAGFLPSVSTSAATLPVGLFTFGDEAIAAPVQVSAVGAGYVVGDTGIGAPAVKAFQWYRNGTAIAKATKAGYTPVAADAGKTLTVRVIHTRLNYTTVVKWASTDSFSE
ncbi:hypothetical protein EYE40_10780 [Glaciihabitans arcticus]|uniref:Peptidase M11 gametolysin domain-containing protein n=1 Tax=Glaciihabitans arcticus TaxID=2668039 RepID=A0A4Q9GUF5_9MICO|nr:hypothetical protein [Glaciihabitans arcticus]TBN57834.1 hypothetical protein EYE40_10780 [Glaciihabitans arcticus]